MAFSVLFNNKKTTYENPLSLLDIIGTDKKYIGGLVNNRIRELTYMIDKDSEVVPLTILDSITKSIYESSLRFLVAMAMHNIRPDIQNIELDSHTMFLDRSSCKFLHLKMLLQELW